MNALKIIFSFVLTFFLSGNAFSQFSYNYDYFNSDIVYEVGLSAGAMNCITDIGGANIDNPTYLNEIRTRNNRFSTGVYAGILFSDIIGAKVEATLGTVTSGDSTITGKSNNLISKRVRNLSFRSKIMEVSLLMEFHPLHLLDIDIIPYFSPYVLGGIGFFRFNPQANLGGKWVDLQPLHTEGQGFAEYPERKNYSLSQFNVPVGFGVRYELSEILNLRVEYLHRRLFTDYLDDASTKQYINPALFAKYLSPGDAANARALFNRTANGSIPIFRGHSQNNDTYMSLTVKLGIVLGWEKSAFAGSRRHLRCKL